MSLKSVAIVDASWDSGGYLRNMRQIETDLLQVAFEDDRADRKNAVLLLHGWPDAPRAWASVASALQAGGWRTVIPYLRGSKPTRFRFQDTVRDGSAIAMAEDAIDLANALGLDRF